MTEATPLASEQITQDHALVIQVARCHLAWIKEGGKEHPHRIAQIELALDRFAALSASPAPSGQGVSGEVDCVTQADRVIAVEVVKKRRGWSSRAVSDILAGRFDSHDAVQGAFLARQHLALAAPAPSCAPGEVERLSRIKALSERILAGMRRIARQDGWALAAHGSMTRDLDVVAVPWTDEASDETAFVEAMRAAVARELGGVAVIGAGEDGRTRGVKAKPHGRRCWTIHSTSEQLVEDERGAHPYVDLSVLDIRANAVPSGEVEQWLRDKAAEQDADLAADVQQGASHTPWPRNWFADAADLIAALSPQGLDAKEGGE